MLQTVGVKVGPQRQHQVDGYGSTPPSGCQQSVDVAVTCLTIANQGKELFELVHDQQDPCLLRLFGSSADECADCISQCVTFAGQFVAAIRDECRLLAQAQFRS